MGLAVVQVLLMMAGLEWVSALEEPQEALISPICIFSSWRVADQPWQKTNLKLLSENTQAAAPSQSGVIQHLALRLWHTHAKKKRK